MQLERAPNRESTRTHTHNTYRGKRESTRTHTHNTYRGKREHAHTHTQYLERGRAHAHTHTIFRERESTRTIGFLQKCSKKCHAARESAE